MKKKQKRPKKYLFARVCRVLGRFLLAIGAILCLSSVILAISPLFFPQKSGSIQPTTPSTIHEDPESPAISTPGVSTTDSTILIIPAIIVTILIILALALAFRSYNANIRNLIARIAKKTRLGIQATELILTTLIWGTVNLVLIFNAPIFVLLSFIAMVINILLFVIAWASYGYPTYSI